jgi:hypothetical protein
MFGARVTARYDVSIVPLSIGELRSCGAPQKEDKLAPRAR